MLNYITEKLSSFIFIFFFCWRG